MMEIFKGDRCKSVRSSSSSRKHGKFFSSSSPLRAGQVLSEINGPVTVARNGMDEFLDVVGLKCRMEKQPWVCQDVAPSENQCADAGATKPNGLLSAACKTTDARNISRSKPEATVEKVERGQILRTLLGSCETDPETAEATSKTLKHSVNKSAPNLGGDPADVTAATQTLREGLTVPRGGSHHSDSGSDDSSLEGGDCGRVVRSPIKQLPAERLKAFVGNLYTESRISYHDHVEDPECPEKVIQVNGRFAKLNVEIGRGSFKTVYKGQDTDNGSTIAWCELQSRSRISQKDHKRFKIEADLLKRLQHPSIIRFYDYWEVVESKSREKYFVLITEFMTSGTLRAYLKNFESKVPLKVVKLWCRKILKGLAYLHSRSPPVIHRDLKCDNIFISGSSGVVKIGDLGLAIITDSNGEARSVIGTPEFMAPEIFDEQYDESVDIYAFGMCIMEMVTKQFPYAECDNAGQVYRKISSGIRPLGYDRIDDLDTKAVVDRCIRFSKLERLTVKDLIGLEFFLDDSRVRVEFSDRYQSIRSLDSIVPVLVRYPDKLLAKIKLGDSRAVQISLNIHTDDPETIVADMAKRSLIPDAETSVVVAHQLRDRICEIKRERAWLLAETNKKGPLLKTQISADLIDGGPRKAEVKAAACNFSFAKGDLSSGAGLDLKELDEKLSTITRFSIIRQEPSTNSGLVSPNSDDANKKPQFCAVALDCAGVVSDDTRNVPGGENGARVLSQSEQKDLRNIPAV